VSFVQALLEINVVSSPINNTINREVIAPPGQIEVTCWFTYAVAYMPAILTKA
jgi:hypothetical protein